MSLKNILLGLLVGLGIVFLVALFAMQYQTLMLVSSDKKVIEYKDRIIVVSPTGFPTATSSAVMKQSTVKPLPSISK